MKTKVVQVMASALLVSTAAFLIAAEIHPAQSGGLTVHEWGTFTSVAGEDGAADRLGRFRRQGRSSRIRQRLRVSLFQVEAHGHRAHGDAGHVLL